MKNRSKSFLILFFTLCLFIMAFPTAFATEVTSITISGVKAPVAGFESRTAYEGIEGSGEGIANYTRQWMQTDSHLVGYYEEFENNKTYRLLFYFQFEEGYTAADDIDIIILNSDTPKQIKSEWRQIGEYDGEILLYYDSIPSYIVTFYPQASNEPTVTQKIGQGRYATLPRQPNKKGYFFGGWFDGRDQEFDPSVPITQDVSYFAKWNEGFTVTAAEFTISEPFVAECGAEITFPEVTLTSVTPSEAFEYASIRQGVYHNNYIWEDEVLENHTKFETGLYKYVVQIRFESVCNGQFFDFPRNITVNGENFALGVIGDYDISYEQRYTLESSIQVDFESNGGTEVDTIYNIVPESKITKPDNPEREGYVFLDWYEDSGFTILFDFENTEITESMTLYARWKKIISVVEIINFHYPIIGKKTSEMPALAVPEGEPYYIYSVEWGHAEQGSGYNKLTEDEVFEEGHIYYAEVTVKANWPDGELVPIDDISVTFNGDSELYWRDASSYTSYLKTFLISTHDMDPVVGRTPGDLNNDTNINIIDVKLLLQKVIAGVLSPTSEEIEVCDLNNDGAINIIDVKLLLQRVISGN